MNIYKVNFANNEVISAEISNLRFDHDSEYYFEYMGKIMYAMVRALNVDDALVAAKRLINNINRKDNEINSRWSAAA